MDNGLTPVMFLVINFLIVPVCFLLFCIIGHLILNRDEIEADEFILEVPNLGGLKFKKYKAGYSRCDESECLFKKYKPVIIIENHEEKSNELYKQIFEYIYMKKEDIENNLKKFYDYPIEEVEKGFKISHIKTVKYNDLVSYVNNLEELGIDILGRDDLKKFIHNSNKDDIFIKITSDFLGYECYAMAYINWRTKEICYCYDDQF